MTKYSAFEEFLKKQDADEIPMTFIEIEKIIGAKLPPSAYKHRPWWSNNRHYRFRFANERVGSRNARCEKAADNCNGTGSMV